MFELIKLRKIFLTLKIDGGEPVGKQRDPKRDEAFEIYKSSGGEINLNVIAAQLGVGDGTLRGWKAKDKWENKLSSVETTPNPIKPNKSTKTTRKERNGTKTAKRNAPINGTERKSDMERSVIEIKNTEQLEEVDDEIIDDDGLTLKQRLFVVYYLIDYNATEAAIKAGYSEKTANVIGYENLTKPLIRDAIKKAINELKVNSDIERQRIVNFLTKAAFSDIRDFLSYETVLTIEGYRDGEPIYSYKKILELKPSDEVDGTLITEIQETKEGLKFKRIDPMKALDLLMKYHGMLHTVVDVKHSGGVKVEHEQHYHITQEIIERNPSFVDNIFGRNPGRSLEDRSSEGEPNGV